MQIVHMIDGDDEVLKVWMDGEKIMLDGDQCDLEMTKAEALELAQNLMHLAQQTKPIPKPKATRKKKVTNENC